MTTTVRQPAVLAHFSNACTWVMRQKITLYKASSRPELHETWSQNNQTKTKVKGETPVSQAHRCTVPTPTGATRSLKCALDPWPHHVTVLLLPSSKTIDPSGPLCIILYNLPIH